MYAWKRGDDEICIGEDGYCLADMTLSHNDAVRLALSILEACLSK